MTAAKPAASAVEFAIAERRWVEAEPVALPEGESWLVRLTFQSAGDPVAIQLLRRNGAGKTVAWIGLHNGPLTSKAVEIDLADLVPSQGMTGSGEDVLVVRFKGVGKPGKLSVEGPEIAVKARPKPPRMAGAHGPEGMCWPASGDADPDRAEDVLVFGTFDVENYGDLLFPIIAAWRLGRAGLSVTPVSPTATKTNFEDSPTPLSFAAAAAHNPPGKAVLIGGGNIVHLRRTALPDYQGGALDTFAYPALWLGATQLAAAYDMPIAWNAPGVPFAEQSWPAKELLSAAAQAADYLSVRDDESKAALGEAGGSAAVVPDSAVEISRIWPLAELEPLANGALECRGLDPNAGYIAVHVKDRSLQGSVEELAASLDALAAESGKAIVLLAVGPCHGDDELARRLGAAMSSPHGVVDRPSSLREIAAIIACADLLICSSLHAYITSFSYGRPGILIGLRHNRKFQAFTRIVERSDDCVFDWDSALESARKRLGKAPGRRDLLKGAISETLDRHWDALIAALAKPEPGRQRRTDFLRSLNAIQLRQRGPAAVATDYAAQPSRMPLLTPFDLVSRFPSKARIIIVGNAPSLRDSNLGEWIDSFDVVVRFNGCAIRGFEQDIGSRTDILVTNPYTETFRRAPADGLGCGMILVIAPQTQRGDKDQFAQWAAGNEVLFTYSPDIYGEALPQRTGSMTTGIYAISLLRRILRPALIGVTGFTLFQDQTAHYWSDEMPSGVASHDLKEDAEVLIALLNSLKNRVVVTSEIEWLSRRLARPLSDRIEVRALADPKWASSG